MLYDPSQSPIERHCTRCGKLIVTLTYNSAQHVWTGDAVRHFDPSTSLYVCRDCDEPDIEKTEAPKKKRSFKNVPY